MKHNNYENAKYFTAAFASAFVAFSLMALGTLLIPLGGTQQAEKPRQDIPTDAYYLPRAEDNMTVLLAVKGGAGEYRFCLALLDVENGGVTARYLPYNILVSYGEKRETLGELYGRDGPRAAKEALAGELGLPVERWMLFVEKKLVIAADEFGPVEALLPQAGDSSVQDSGTPATNGRMHTQRLDGEAFCTLLFAPDTPDEAAQAAVQAYLDAALAHTLLEDADEIFRTVVNLADTDISFMDYDNRREALRFLASLGSGEQS